MTGNKTRLGVALAIGLLCGSSPARTRAVEALLTERLEQLARAEGEDAARTARAPELARYLAAALRDNPGVTAARYRWQAALVRAGGATALSEPRVAYSYSARSVETRVGPQRHKLSLAQGFPWLGVRQLRGEVAQAEAAARFQEYEAAKLRVYGQVVDAYAEYFYLGSALAVAREHVELMRRLEEVARRRYAVGEAPHSAAIQARVELARLEDRVRSLEDRRQPEAATINGLLNRPVRQSLPWPQDPGLPGAADRVDLTEETAATWLPLTHPGLRQLEELAGRASAATELAGKRAYPDITVGLDYVETGKPVAAGVPEAGRDAVMVMVSATVPLWRAAYGAAVRASRLEAAALRERREDLANQLMAALDAGLHRARDSQSRLVLHRDTLVPLTEQSVEVTRRAFESGQATFTALVDAQRQLLDLELGYERARADRLAALGQLSALLNRDLVHGGQLHGGQSDGLGGDPDL